MLTEEVYASLLFLLFSIIIAVFVCIIFYWRFLIGALWWILKGIGKLFVLLWDGIKFIWCWIWDNILKPFYDSVIKPAGLAIWNVLKSIWNNFLDALGWAKGIAVDVVDEAKDLGGKAVDGAKKLGSSLLGVLEDSAGEFFGAIGDVVSSVVDAVKSAVNAIIDAIKPIIEDILNLIQPVVDFFENVF